MKNRIARVLLGLLVLALFAAYTYLRVSTSPRARDFDTPSANSEVSGTISPARPADEEPGEPEADPEETEDPTAEAESEATPEPTVDPDSPYGKALANAAAKGLPAPPEIDVSEWTYVLVNGDHSIDQYAPEQLAYLNQTATETDIQYSYNPNRCPVDASIAEALLAFAQGCRDAGLPVFLSSGYRSYNDQAQNFIRVCNNNGVTDGKDSNGHYITMPAGCSEHQAALCCDITDIYRPIKNAEIEKTETFQWLKAHCAEYGFVHRFPAGKEDITGVMYEPFHFRYVGVEAATYMMDNELCLEEFLALYGVV